MSWLRRFVRRLRASLFRARDDDRVREELAEHLTLLTEEYTSAGLPLDEARRRARLRLGAGSAIEEQYRDEQRLRVLEDLGQDLRYGLRTLIRTPRFTVTAVLVLAVGIGANTSVFSVADAILLRSLPVGNPQELVAFDWLRTSDSMVARYSGYGRRGPSPELGIRTSFSSLTVERFRDHTASLASVFAFSPAGTLAVGRPAETASGLFVSGDYFAGLGIQPSLGRVLSMSDDLPGAEPVAVISHRYWQRHFAGDRSVVGKMLDVNRVAVAIVGITPAGFDGPRMTESYDLTLPIAVAARLHPGGRAHPVSLWWLQMMGRLKPGVTREQALADLQSTFAETVRESWAARPPDTPNPARSHVPQLRVHAGARGPDGPRLDAQDMLSVTFVIAALILLIGCVNLAGLLLVRASARRREVTLRVMLGASRWRVIRQLMTEALVLALLGGVGGAIFAWWGKDFAPWLPTRETFIVDARIDPRVLAFAVALSAITTLIVGIGPAVRATRPELDSALKTTVQKGSAVRGIATQALLAAQIAISLVLLVGAGLLMRTLYNFSTVDLGFNADNILLFRIDAAGQNDSPSRVFDKYDRILAAIEAVPGVQSCTMSVMPLIARGEWEEIVQPDGGNPQKSAFIQVARWNFLETMGVPLLAGRHLTAADIEGRPRVAVINETMAREVFGEQTPLGRRFHFVEGADRNTEIEVVGVARDAKYSSLEQPVPATLFMPHAQMAPSDMTVEVRTGSDPAAFTSVVREAVRGIDPSTALVDMRTQRQQIADTVAQPRLIAALTTVSGLIGLLLACMGLYGAVSYETIRRTPEIGIRMALGAQRSDVLRLVMRQAVVVVAIGAGIGITLVLAASRLLASVLFGVGPSDPLAIGLALAVLAAVALAASYLPARRALQLDPTEALRSE